MFNLINACTIVLIFTLSTRAVHNSNDGLFNVGSVLFTSSHLDKKRWSKSNIETLQARKHFQNIIPAPSMNSINENYIKNLLKYFTNTFATLKRETYDPALLDIMEKALSDVVGGYFKVWVLPVTKLTYYGGVMSQESATQAFEFYERLKKNLNTDGRRWRRPSEIILKTIAITVIPLTHAPYTRSMKYPCDSLAYFEQSDSGFTIPTPIIKWDESPHIMFLPLKNNSLVQLDSPSASNSLMRYYDVAEGCCQSRNPDTCNNFDQRFQEWVSKNVVPHIHDDKLYLAFGSLLGILNRTDGFIEKTSNLWDYECESVSPKSLISKLPPCMSTKKFYILTIILIIEIVWCVPALIYIMCSKKKYKLKCNRTKFFLDAFKRHGCQTIGRTHNKERNIFVNKNDLHNYSKMGKFSLIEKGLKLVHKPRPKIKENVIQVPSHVFTRSTGQVTSAFADIKNEAECQCESVTLINEKITMNASCTSNAKLRSLPTCSCRNITYSNDNKSSTKTETLETTVTKIVNDKTRSNSKSAVTVTCTSTNKIESELKQKLLELEDAEVAKGICPCTHCFSNEPIVREVLKVTTPKQSRAIKARGSDVAKPRNVPKITSRAKPTAVQPKVCYPRNSKLNETKGLKINTGEPLLEIRIDKPATAITLDITRTCGKNVKPSRIPRLAPTARPGQNETTKTSVCVQQASKIVKRRSKDDSEIKRKVIKHSKMNVTL